MALPTVSPFALEASTGAAIGASYGIGYDIHDLYQSERDQKRAHEAEERHALRALELELGLVDLPPHTNKDLRLEHAALTRTLGRPIGAYGFVGAYAINYPNQIIEIVVQFVTPPAVALRLMHERGMPYGRIWEWDADDFEGQALAAHSVFESQFAQIPMSLSDFDPYVFSYNYQLFNGVFMRVPGYMAEMIAVLPEVYGVFPNFRIWAPEVIPFGDPTTYLGESVIYEGFMRETREHFNIDYIHNVMGITGYGVTVAVIDSGIQHDHPVFERWYDSTTGLTPGFCVIRNEPDARERPGEADFGHGTHVAGTVVAIAPEIYLRSYRTLGAPGGGTWSDRLVRAIELAHESSDIMNLSIHWETAHTAGTHVINTALDLAAMDDSVVVVIAGNFGRNRRPYTLSVMGQGSLPIIVAAGTAGGLDEPRFGDTISLFSSHGPVPITYHINPDIAAPGVGIVSAFPGSTYVSMSGTSMAAPSIAGIAALILQAFPDIPPGQRNAEVKARMMNTARPLADIETEVHRNCVFAVGAGFVHPIQALRSDAFATVEHPINRTFWPSIGEFEYHTMSSLSFGVVEGPATDLMTVTINSPGLGTWVPQVHFNNASHTGVSLVVTPASESTFEVQMTFAPGTPIGVYQGNLIFESGTRQITMPFAALLDGEPTPIDITYDFVCLNFRNAVRTRVNRPEPERIFYEDVSRIAGLWVQNLGITSLAGIEHFTSLHTINFMNNNMTGSVDFSENLFLNEIWAPGNLLTSVNIVNNRYLRWVNFRDSNLTQLDVSNNHILEEILIERNNIDSMDLSNNRWIRWFRADNNGMTQLILTEHPILHTIWMPDNRLTELNLSGSPHLHWVGVNGSSLTSVDLTNNPILEEFRAWNNELTEIDMTNNPRMRWLDLGSNNLTQVDVLGNPILASLWVNWNYLTELNLSNNPLLSVLNVQNNNLNVAADVVARPSATGEVWLPQRPADIGINPDRNVVIPALIYGQPLTTNQSVSMTIMNTGNRQTGALTITSGSDFVVYPTEIENIPLGQSATFTVTPTVTRLGTHTTGITIIGTHMAAQVLHVSFLVTSAHIADVALVPLADVHFGSTPVGYAPVTPHTVTIQNVGTVPVDGFETIFTSGSGFILTPPITTYLPVGESTTFTVAPQSGLGTGMYTAIVEVRPLNSGFAPIPFSVAFDVLLMLTAPTGLNVVGTVLSWDTVTAAAGYGIYVNNVRQGATDAATSSFDLAALRLPVGTHTIQVRAIGDTVTFDSDMSEPLSYVVGALTLPAPANPRIAGSIFRWNVVSNAVGYRIYANSLPVSAVITDTLIDLSELSLDGGINQIQVRAVGDGVSFLDSSLSAEVIFEAPYVVKPEFSLLAFNNGNDNNASLAQAGLIRIWTRLDGVSELVPYTDLEVSAKLPDGTCAMEFIRINQPWNNPGYVNLIDANKHAPWATIYLTATLGDQSVELTLINNRSLGLRAFNNGTDAEVPSMAGNIRIWPQLGGDYAPIPRNAVIEAVDQDGFDALELIVRNRLWTDAGWQDSYVNFDVSKDAPWQTIYFTITVYGQTVSVLLINDWLTDEPEPIPVFGIRAFNNGTDAQVPSLAGTIRIWTQLDGANALVPFADLIVEATLMDGTCAMEFVRINRVWNNPDYVSLFDVNKDAPWQYINFSATLFGQNNDLLLINNRYVTLGLEL